MEAWEAEGIWADPGRVHAEGRHVRAVLEDARDSVAGLLGVRPRQVVFTSGGTEANNASLFDASPGPILVAEVEHPSVTGAARRAGPTTTIEVDPFGRITTDALDEALARSVAEHGRTPTLVCCQWANHEVATAQPVEAVVAWGIDHDIPVHVDATMGVVPSDLGARTMTITAHRLGGPVGLGVQVVARGERLHPFLLGGEQERARRAGLENVRAAVGFAAVADHLSATWATESALARRRTERLVSLATAQPGVTHYGDPDQRADHVVCVGIDGVEAEPVLLALDQAGIAAHSGASCSSETLEPSPVLVAMGVDAERSLRLSVGWSTTEDDIEAFAEAFPRVLTDLRALRA